MKFINEIYKKIYKNNKGSSLALLMSFMGVGSLMALGTLSSLYEGMDAAKLVQIQGAIHALEAKIQTNDWSQTIKGTGCGDFLYGDEFLSSSGNVTFGNLKIPSSTGKLVSFISPKQKNNRIYLDGNNYSYGDYLGSGLYLRSVLLERNHHAANANYCGSCGEYYWINLVVVVSDDDPSKGGKTFSPIRVPFLVCANSGLIKSCTASEQAQTCIQSGGLYYMESGREGECDLVTVTRMSAPKARGYGGMYSIEWSDSGKNKKCHASNPLLPKGEKKLTGAMEGCECPHGYDAQMMTQLTPPTGPSISMYSCYSGGCDSSATNRHNIKRLPGSIYAGTAGSQHWTCQAQNPVVCDPSPCASCYKACDIDPSSLDCVDCQQRSPQFCLAECISDYKKPLDPLTTACKTCLNNHNTSSIKSCGPLCSGGIPKPPGGCPQCPVGKVACPSTGICPGSGISCTVGTCGCGDTCPSGTRLLKTTSGTVIGTKIPDDCCAISAIKPTSTPLTQNEECCTPTSVASICTTSAPTCPTPPCTTCPTGYSFLLDASNQPIVSTPIDISQDCCKNANIKGSPGSQVCCPDNSNSHCPTGHSPLVDASNQPIYSGTPLSPLCPIPLDVGNDCCPLGAIKGIAGSQECCDPDGVKTKDSTLSDNIYNPEKWNPVCCDKRIQKDKDDMDKACKEIKNNLNNLIGFISDPQNPCQCKCPTGLDLTNLKDGEDLNGNGFLDTGEDVNNNGTLDGVDGRLDNAVCGTCDPTKTCCPGKTANMPQNANPADYMPLSIAGINPSHRTWDKTQNKSISLTTQTAEVDVDPSNNYIKCCLETNVVNKDKTFVDTCCSAGAIANQNTASTEEQCCDLNTSKVVKKINTTDGCPTCNGGSQCDKGHTIDTTIITTEEICCPNDQVFDDGTNKVCCNTPLDTNGNCNCINPKIECLLGPGYVPLKEAGTATIPSPIPSTGGGLQRDTNGALECCKIGQIANENNDLADECCGDGSISAGVQLPDEKPARESKAWNLASSPTSDHYSAIYKKETSSGSGTFENIVFDLATDPKKIEMCCPTSFHQNAFVGDRSRADKKQQPEEVVNACGPVCNPITYPTDSISGFSKGNITLPSPAPEEKCCPQEQITTGGGNKFCCANNSDHIYVEGLSQALTTPITSICGQSFSSIKSFKQTNGYVFDSSPNTGFCCNRKKECCPTDQDDTNWWKLVPKLHPVTNNEMHNSNGHLECIEEGGGCPHHWCQPFTDPSNTKGFIIETGYPYDADPGDNQADEPSQTRQNEGTDCTSWDPVNKSKTPISTNPLQLRPVWGSTSPDGTVHSNPVASQCQSKPDTITWPTGLSINVEGIRYQNNKEHKNGACLYGCYGYGIKTKILPKLRLNTITNLWEKDTPEVKTCCPHKSQVEDLNGTPGIKGCCVDSSGNFIEAVDPDRDNNSILDDQDRNYNNETSCTSCTVLASPAYNGETCCPLENRYIDNGQWKCCQKSNNPDIGKWKTPKNTKDTNKTNDECPSCEPEKQNNKGDCCKNNKDAIEVKVINKDDIPQSYSLSRISINPEEIKVCEEDIQYKFQSCVDKGGKQASDKCYQYGPLMVRGHSDTSISFGNDSMWNILPSNPISNPIDINVIRRNSDGNLIRNNNTAEINKYAYIWALPHIKADKTKDNKEKIIIDFGYDTTYQRLNSPSSKARWTAYKTYSNYYKYNYISYSCSSDLMQEPWSEINKKLCNNPYRLIHNKEGTFNFKLLIYKDNTNKTNANLLKTLKFKLTCDDGYTVPACRYQTCGNPRDNSVRCSGSLPTSEDRCFRSSSNLTSTQIANQCSVPASP